MQYCYTECRKKPFMLSIVLRNVVMLGVVAPIIYLTRKKALAYHSKMFLSLSQTRKKSLAYYSKLKITIKRRRILGRRLSIKRKNDTSLSAKLYIFIKNATTYSSIF
jgi:hypothetical protein